MTDIIPSIERLRLQLDFAGFQGKLLHFLQSLVDELELLHFKKKDKKELLDLAPLATEHSDPKKVWKIKMEPKVLSSNWNVNTTELSKGKLNNKSTKENKMDKKIKKTEKTVAKAGKELKSLEKADHKRDKVCDYGKKEMAKNKKK
jgi:hypothetical protein